MVICHYKFRYEPTAKEIKDSWLELADPIEKFIDERTTKMSSGYTMIVKLYNSYQKYCKEKGLVPKTQKYFYQKFSSITGISSNPYNTEFINSPDPPTRTATLFFLNIEFIDSIASFSKSFILYCS